MISNIHAGLDSVLSSLAVIKESESMTFEKLYDLYKEKKPSTSPIHFARILNHLKNDGLIIEGNEGDIHGDTQSPTHSIYTISISGELLLERGGYVQAKRNAKNKIIYKRIVNILLAFAGLATGIFYAKEIIHSIFSYFIKSCHCF